MVENVDREEIMTTTRPKRKQEGIIAQDIGNEVLLRNTQGKTIHVLNSTAKTIWMYCDGNHTIEDIEQTIKDNFSLGKDHDVRADILKTLEVFSEKGLLEKSA